MITILILYAAVIAAIVITSMKSTQQHHFYSGGRMMGSWVLLLALFATNMTSISLIGVPNQAFGSGFMVFLAMGIPTAIIVPLMFKYMDTKACEQSGKHGFLTQGELVSIKTGSTLCGQLISVCALFF